MLIKDDSCIAEQTILRYQSNNIPNLMGSDWYGILLRSPEGETTIDTYFDVSSVDNSLILDFANQCVTYNFLQNGVGDTFCYQDSHFFVYPIRKTNRGYIVFFLFFRKDSAFPAHDIAWYTTYAKTAYQRVLLENELVQVQNYNNILLENSECAIVVVDKKYCVLSSNPTGATLFGSEKLNIEAFLEPSALLNAIQDVLVGGKKRSLLQICHVSEGKFPKRSLFSTSISPLPTSKGVISAVIIQATDITNINMDNRIADRRHYYKDTVNIFRSFLNNVRSSIMNIKGCAELLGSGNDQPAENGKLIEYILGETDQVEKACTDFDAFQAVTQDGEYEKSDLNKVLRNCMTIIHRKSGIRQVEMHLHTRNDSLSVTANSGDLYMVFLTLMEDMLNLIQCSGAIDISAEVDSQQGIVKTEIRCKYDGEDPRLQNAIDVLVPDIIEKYEGEIRVGKVTDKSILCTICIPAC